MSKQPRRRPRMGKTGGTIRSRRVVIQSGRPELESRIGYIMQCVCGSDRWLVWILETHQSPHLQCVDCGDVYCMGEDCGHEEEDDRKTAAELEEPPPASGGG